MRQHLAVLCILIFLVSISSSLFAPNVKATSTSTTLDPSSPSILDTCNGVYTESSGIGTFSGPTDYGYPGPPAIAVGQASAMIQWSIESLVPANPRKVSLSFELLSHVIVPGPFGLRVQATVALADPRMFEYDDPFTDPFNSCAYIEPSPGSVAAVTHNLGGFVIGEWFDVGPSPTLASGSGIYRAGVAAGDNTFHSYKIEIDFVAGTTTFFADGSPVGSRPSVFVPKMVSFGSRSHDPPNTIETKIRAISLEVVSAAKYALIVGIEEFALDLGLGPNLHSASDDAFNFLNVLVSDFGFSTDAEFVRLFQDDVRDPSDDVTGAFLFGEIQRLIDKATPGDTVVIYIAAHGAHDLRTGQTFLVVHDEAIPDTDFAFLVNHFDLGVRLLIVLDVSDAGGLIPELALDLDNSPAANRIVIGGCGTPPYHNQNEDCKEIRFGRDEPWFGVFTRFFVQALDGAGDLNNDGEVSIEEAFNYARDQMMNHRNPRIYQQNPAMYDGFSGEMFL